MAKSPKTPNKSPPKEKPPAIDHPPHEHDAADSQPPPMTFPIVGIGASAGGLEACSEFLSAMPADTGMAFIIVLHLDPHHESMMAGLLARHTAMPVVEVADAAKIEPNHVYVIPPNKFITLKDGDIVHETPVTQRGIRLPIDHFFRSLAQECGDQAIAIILTGTGSDGAAGVKEIKNSGGMTLVQDPDSAAYDGMPRAALMTGTVDEVLAIEAMPELLVNFARHTYLKSAITPHPLDEVSPTQFRNIINILRLHTDTDFNSYRKGTLSRRIYRRMGLRQVPNVGQYVEILRKDREEVQHLFKDLLISVTQFFRDPEAWAALESTVIVPLIQRKSSADPIRVWVAGCATGEEAYSVAMLLHEQMEKLGKPHSLQIFATDLDEAAITVARNALYPESIVADVTPARLEKFFTQENGHYRVSKRIRESVICASQNLLTDPPFSKLDLITCRNVLMYFEADVQRRFFELFHFALANGGHLFLGKSESLGQASKLFALVTKEWRIFRRLDVARTGHIFPPQTAVGTATSREARGVDAHIAQVSRGEAAKRALLERFAPAAVLVNRHYEAQYFHGPVRDYLDIPSGEPTMDITAMAVDGLRTKLKDALQKASQAMEHFSTVARRVKRNGSFVSVNISVEPIGAGRPEERLILVCFSDEPATALSQPAEPTAASMPPTAEATEDADALQLLERELRATRADLQTTIEELETSNEELKASNEEVMSMNEEFQSTNEELETSREELQSLNEELTTVNRQLEEKLSELEIVNNDLINLLSSTRIATLFLGLDNKIRRFTPASSDLFSIIEADIGRPISDLASRIADDRLPDDIGKVIETLTPVATEVQTNDGKWFLRKVLPYRTADNKIEGVVVTFTDVSTLKAVAGALSIRERQQTAIAELGRAALSRMPIDELLDTTAQILPGLLHCEYSKILQLTSDRRHFLLRSGVGWRPGLVGTLQIEAGLGSQAGYAVEFDRPVIVADISTEKRFSVPTYFTEHSVASSACVPIGPAGRSWGTLCVCSVHEQSFAVDDIAFLQAVANLLSESILRTDAEETLSDSETRLQALASELDHRVKNILARFSVIVQRARDDAHSVEELSEGLSGRIDSMVRTQALLSRAEWKSMPLRVLIDAELKPYASADNISIDCERVVVNPTAAQALSMVFHELATNAAKFGALARSTGSIAIAARTVPSTMPAGSETLLIEWQEKGGPVVKPPQREGFGSEVIKGLLTHELDAEVKVTYEAEGLRCDIAIPRNKIAGP